VPIAKSWVEKAFDLLARVRSAPAFHPRGRLYDAVLELDSEAPLPVGDRPALVRLSRGAGLPDRVPDFLGVAVRIDSDANEHVDFLCTSTVGADGWGRWLIAPARRWAGTQLTTLMPWEAGEQRRLVLLRVADDRLRTASPDIPDSLPVTFALLVVDEGGAPVQEGTLTLTAPSPTDPATVAFDPLLHAPAGWRVGPRWLAWIRESAYVGSRAGRGADDPST
jgi:hypothetical protein